MLEFNEFDNHTRKTLFADVVLPLAISRNYTYRVPVELNESIEIGKRVVVQFGKSKIYTALVYSVSQNPPAGYEAKYLIDVLDDLPIVTPDQFRLWDWISGYYMCTLGEVMQAALPSALKLASETRIVLRNEFEFDRAELSDKEFLILDALEIAHELQISDIVKLLGQKTVFPIVRSLFNKGIVIISENISDKFKPRKKTFIGLNPEYDDPASRKALFEVLEKSPRQQDILLAWLKLSKENKEISRTDLLEASGAGSGSLKTLIDKNIFFQESKVVSRFNIESAEDDLTGFQLNESQNNALYKLKSDFETNDVCLLHGITSSGKTLVYVKLIEETLANNQQVLYLLPEIALTTQVVERLKLYFGNQIGIYHSRFNENERAEVWQKVLTGEYKLILGARSAVFLPFNSLGLIVVDEEHESSYKQYDPAPRYHARDTAIYLASVFKAKVILGSATPSVETFYNAQSGKYGFAELTERFGGVLKPDVEVVSLTEETRLKTIQSHFTSVLVNAITEAVKNKEQAILFQNRRGYTPVILCTTCGFSPKCINCDVNLTYHKSSGKLHCHYCGYRQSTISECPACGSTKIEQKGFGTEKVEDELQLIFPELRIARMDLDTTRSRNSFQQLFSDFDDGRIDVLVGTQMVAKGLDFANVTTIGIINADSMLNYPDFRAYERSYQLLQQVAGRAGRRNKTGKVIIQAYSTNHRIIEQVISNDFSGMYNAELAERQNFHYPPFYRLIELNIKHKDQVKLSAVSNALATELRAKLGNRILGPEQPLISRIRNYYIQQLIVKAHRETDSISKIKSVVQQVLIQIDTDARFKGTVVQIDVDPY